ncbi:MAG: prephenate dehydrogenase/arogenate dehydrogenase family protein, partial [Clostridia bacterium]|nr:prephenate dehydrogenase/arogenate dehydrogenase family protein [Clostridia bacterium]
MTVRIEKCSPQGSVVAPPSKSLSHRALICASLSGGSVTNLAWSKDIEATLSCLVSLGAKAEKGENSVTFSSFDPFEAKEPCEIFCNESGSTLRFLIPLCLLSGESVTLSGSERLFSRPLSVYEELFCEKGIYFKRTKKSITVKGRLTSGVYRVAGNISSQFVSGLLFALPLLDGDSRIEIEGRLESASYISLTLSVLSDFGIYVKWEGNTLFIKGNQSYKSRSYKVEGDCSNAAFLDALNLLGGNVTVEGINEKTLQGDRVYKSYFEALKKGEKHFDLSDCPDLAPIMFALSAAMGGATFEGTARLRIKESDRSAAMAKELSKFGIEMEVGENSCTVKGGTLKAPTETLCGHNDHRIVMALSVLSTLTGGYIDGAEAVSKSYPDFFEVLKSINTDLRRVELDKNKSILIVGLGLLGGSYAMALKRKGYRVSAITKEQSSIEFALNNGIIDEGSTALDERLINEAGLIVFALYPKVFTEWVSENGHLIKRGTLITDVTGVKECIVNEIQKKLGDGVEFVSAHPMAGRELSGVEHSDDAIFKNANYIVVPTEKNTNEGIALCKELGEELGFSRISVLDPKKHDEMIAFL